MNYQSLIEILRAKRLLKGEVCKMYKQSVDDLGINIKFSEPMVVTAYSLAVMSLGDVHPYTVEPSDPVMQDAVVFFHTNVDGTIDYIVEKSDAFVATGCVFMNTTGVPNRFSVFIAGYALDKNYLKSFQ